jgi:hypothetical protein
VAFFHELEVRLSSVDSATDNEILLLEGLQINLRIEEDGPDRIR